MRLSRRTVAPVSGLNMTPMIDIVFLLLVFFMTVSQITQNMTSGIRLPEVDSAGNEELSRAAEILVLADGGLRMDGKVVSVGELVGLLGQRAALAELPVEQMQIQLRIDRDCDSAVVNRVLGGLAAGGVRRVWSAVMTH